MVKSMQQVQKYVLDCSDGIIQFLSTDERQDYITVHNVVDYTLSEFVDNIQTEPDLLCVAEISVQNALAFSNSVLMQFLAENSMLGVYQSGMSQALRGILEPTFEALLTGSLQDAVVLLKAIPSTSYDSIFITERRLLCYINVIEDYLGYPVTAALT